MWNYVSPVIVAVLAGFQLAKDWSAHQTTWRRAVILILIVLLAIGGAINTYYAKPQHLSDEDIERTAKGVVQLIKKDQEAQAEARLRKSETTTAELGIEAIPSRSTDVRLAAALLKELRANPSVTLPQQTSTAGVSIQSGSSNQPEAQLPVIKSAPP